ncbi:MAG: DUF5615 family PIN-like protein [bacterium]
MQHKRIKFLIDVGASNKVEQWLQNRGYDVKCIRKINPRLTDVEILKIAVSERRMIITMDKDFGELIYHCGLAHAGVMLLRLGDAHSKEKIKVVENILKNYSDKILNRFCVYQNGILRIRG